jgi:hypothetical protein
LGRNPPPSPKETISGSVVLRLRRSRDHHPLGLPSYSISVPGGSNLDPETEGRGAGVPAPAPAPGPGPGPRIPVFGCMKSSVVSLASVSSPKRRHEPESASATCLDPVLPLTTDVRKRHKSSIHLGVDDDDDDAPDAPDVDKKGLVSGVEPCLPNQNLDSFGTSLRNAGFCWFHR